MTHTILLVDDDIALRNFIKKALEKEGYVVYDFDNGQDAYDSFLCGHVSYDLVLSDIVMLGMDGMELATKIKRQNATIPLIFTTGFSGMVTNDDIPVIAKPFHLKDVVAQVNMILKN